MSDIYEKLREKLDSMATGFPRSESGVEMSLLKRLFNEQEAEIVVRMSPGLHPVGKIAAEFGWETAVANDRLESMAQKGLLFRRRKGDEVFYSPVPYVVGIFEYQLKRLNPETARQMEQYFDEAFGASVQSFRTPLMRTIPIGEELVNKWPVAPYESVARIIDNQSRIAIAECVCRVTAKLSGGGCDKPLETCFLFGAHADYYVENGMGRYIDKEEAKAIAQRNDEAGLVMQPFNSQKVGGMCSCCGDCCAVLRSLKMQSKPARAVQSSYQAEVEASLCSLCEECIERCHMDAVMVEEEAVSIDLDRCIGCGLCVTTCPTEAITLVRRPEEELYEPPVTGAETYRTVAKERMKH